MTAVPQEARYPYPDEPERTHWDGCWQALGHHNCAVIRVYEAEARLSRLEAAARTALEATMNAGSHDPGDIDQFWKDHPRTYGTLLALRAALEQVEGKG